MEELRFMDILGELRNQCTARDEKIRRSLSLSEAEYKALLILSCEDHVTCQEVASRMNLSLSRASRVIERLFEKGLAKREGCTSDRRCKRVWLTGKGKEVRSEIENQIQRCESTLLKKIANAEIRLPRFRKDLKNLITSLDEVNEEI